MPVAAPTILINWNTPQGFKAYAKALRLWYPELKKELLHNLQAAGKLVQVDAKKNAAYSHEIPASLKVRVSGLSVSIQTPSSDAPGSRTFIRALEEYAPGNWSHPVFGSGLVTQDARPYLAPAVTKNTEAVYLLVEAAVSAAGDVVMEA